MKDLTIEKINIMAGSYDKLVAQNKELQKENRKLRQLIVEHNISCQVAKLFTILSKKEYEVLSLISKGLNNKEIANRLCVELRTVRTHVNHIYQKLEIDTTGCGSTARVKAALKFLGKG